MIQVRVRVSVTVRVRVRIRVTVRVRVRMEHEQAWSIDKCYGQIRVKVSVTPVQAQAVRGLHNQERGTLWLLCVGLQAQAVWGLHNQKTTGWGQI